MRRAVLLLLAFCAACKSRPTSIGMMEPGTDARAYAAGLALFSREETAPALGPDYNAVSCVACHFGPVTGGEGDLSQLMVPDHPLHHVGREDTPGHASRLPPPLFGIGELDRIPDAEIVCGGKGFRVVKNSGVARFGRRLTTPHAGGFVVSALAREEGICTHVDPTEKTCPASEPAEMSEQDVHDLRVYVNGLAAPPEGPAARDGDARDRFTSIGCATCHVLATQGTDLCAHDLGEELAEDDADVGGPMTRRHWRTAPLVGLGYRRFLLHDGRARSVEAAIRAHGGEAAPSVAAFAALSDADRASLLAFVSAR